MVIKMGRYGKFYACPNYPKCHNIKPILQTIDAPCPKCGGQVLVRHSRKGRLFYGCKNYPQCDFVSWEMPIKDKCPQCGSYMVRKRDKKGTEVHQCANTQCSYHVTVETPEEA